MNVSAAASASARLERLAGYLRQDPANASLLADACDTALACGRHDRVESYIVTAERLSLDAQEWGHRRAQLCIARGDLGQARKLLEQLRADDGGHPVVAHDLAHVCLLQGDAAQAHALLQPWADDGFRGAGLPQGPSGVVQSSWLRACHHLGRLQEAWDWTRRAQAAGMLQPGAAGVASLIAFDMDEPEVARALADVALAVDPEQHEALLTKGSLALATRDAAGAAHFLARALERHPGDGRAWSALGFASLLSRDLPAAREELERAVQAMPDHGQTWQALGWTRLMLDDRAGAQVAFGTALRLEASAEAHAAMALALVLGGDGPAAARHLDAAEALDSGEVASRMARAILAGGGKRGELQALVQALMAQWRPRP